MAPGDRDFDRIRSWQRVARDAAIVVIGGFMLVYETVAVPVPNPYIIGAGLVALGVPPALRYDERSRNEDD